jgi:hypothetical protein
MWIYVGLQVMILTSVDDALALLKLNRYGSSSRNGNDGGDDCNKLHGVCCGRVGSGSFRSWRVGL